MRNYRIIAKAQKTKNKKLEKLLSPYVYGLAEVYYNDDKEPEWYTEPDIWFENPSEIIPSLKMMLEDAKKWRRQILEVKGKKLIKHKK